MSRCEIYHRKNNDLTYLGVQRHLLPARRLWGHLSETMLLVGAFMLTGVKIKQAKPEAKLYLPYDQGGLYIELRED